MAAELASESLLTAIDELDVEAVESMLELDPLKRLGACRVDEDGQPLILRAIFSSDPNSPDASLAMVRTLLAAGADPAQADGDGSSALHVAASKLTLEPAFASAALEALLERLREAPDQLRDAEGATPLAIVLGRIAAVGGQLSAEGEDAITAAAHLLLESGSSVLGCAGAPPPEAAAAAAVATGSDEALAQSATASPDALPPATLLHGAAATAPPALVRALLRADDVESAMAIADEWGDGPLQVALAHGRRDVAAAILDAFPSACEGPWVCATDRRTLRASVPREERTLAYAVHRLIAGAARTQGGRSSSLASKGGATNENLASCARLLIERHGAPVDARDTYGRTPLASALASKAPSSFVAELLRHDHTPEAVDADGRCPLMHAASASEPHALATLLAAAADDAAASSPASPPPQRVLAADCNGFTALMLAASAKCVEAVTLLLTAGSDVQAVDATGRCALLLALMPPNVEPPSLPHHDRSSAKAAHTHADDATLAELMRLLAAPPPAACLALVRRAEAVAAAAPSSSAAADAADLGLASAPAEAAAEGGGAPRPPSRGGTPLGDEAARAAGSVAAALMACVCSSDGQCALASAAALESPAAIDILAASLDAAGAPLPRCAGLAVVAASAAGEVTAVRRLLAKDAERRLLSPLGARPSLGSLGCLASPSVLASSIASLPASAAVAAASHGHAEVLRALLEHDRSVASHRTKRQQTPLMAAAAAGSVSSVQQLLDSAGAAGADGAGAAEKAGLVGATDDAGRSALMHAAADGRERACLDALIGAGADPRGLDTSGCTPLMHAARGGDVGCVETLLAAAPDLVSVRDENGSSALLHCASGGHTAALSLLASHGESLDAGLEAALRGARREWDATARLVAVETLAKVPTL